MVSIPENDILQPLIDRHTEQRIGNGLMRVPLDDHGRQRHCDTCQKLATAEVAHATWSSYFCETCEIARLERITAMEAL